MTKSQLMDICNDLADYFNLSVSSDTVELGLIRFASSLEAYNEQSAGRLTFRMTNVKSFCIGDADNDGCRISRKESSDSKTTVNIDFELTSSKLCSISYCVEQSNWSFFEKHGKHLCFEIYSDAKLIEAEIELHFSDHNEIVPILIDDDRRWYKISLTQFSASEADWKCVKEVCVLIRKKYINHSTSVVIENLRLE